jgi:hypothetical protein
MAILNNSNAISSGGYDINNSLRFRSSASAYLNRTPASSGSLTTWTWSCWVKRGALGIGRFLSAGTAGTDIFGFLSTDTFQFYTETSAATNLVTTQVFRDPSAWYHIVVVWDTTQATAANRVKIYVNGTQITAFSSATYPAQNGTSLLNSNTAQNIGRRLQLAAEYLDGYMTEVNFIDGSAKTPSDFGETDTTTGSWKPKAYTGTYGTNGFYLKFSDIATTSGSNAGLGKDFSGNGNYWTTNNISVTAGTTYDAMIDSPTLTSATVANYCVLNPFLKYSGLSAPTNGNLTIAGNNANWRSILSSFAVSSGKWYCEINMTSVSTDALVGIFNINTASDLNDLTTVDNRQIGRYSGGYSYQNNGNKVNNNTATAYGSTWTTGDVIGIALDMDAGTIVFYKNNTSQGTAYSSLSGLFAIGISTANGTFDPNFGQRPFSYTPPTGFVRLNAYNLPDSTIKKGNTNFDVLTYTGNGATSRSFTGLSFQPDLIWNKDRTTAYSHRIVDSVRGVRKELYSNTTDQELDQWSTYGSVNSFDTNGYTITTGGTAGNFIANLNGDAQVAWIWKASGSTSSNTSGTITSTVSVNTTAGFSVVTYTGNNVAGATIGHGLGVAPSIIIVKKRSTTGDWPFYHRSLGATGELVLNSTTAFITITGVWNNTAPTSSVFSVGGGGASGSGDVNANAATYVAYCWAEIAGFSKFGSYTGNFSADGPFIYTGFRPAFILLKNSNTTDSWVMKDDQRAANFNPASGNLYSNLSLAEDTGSGGDIDFLSNGFKIRGVSNAISGNGNTIIYAAFAENPLKNSLAR